MCRPSFLAVSPNKRASKQLKFQAVRFWKILDQQKRVKEKEERCWLLVWQQPEKVVFVY